MTIDDAGEVGFAGRDVARNKLFAHQSGKPIDGDGVNLDGKRTGFPGVLGGLYGPVTGVLQCGDAFFEASISAVDGQGRTGQATSDAALRMACSNASGGWAPVIR